MAASSRTSRKWSVTVTKDAVMASRPSGVAIPDGCGISVLTNPADELGDGATWAEMNGKDKDNVARLANIRATGDRSI